MSFTSLNDHPTGKNLLATLPNEILDVILRIGILQLQDVAALSLTSTGLVGIASETVGPVMLCYAAVKACERNHIFRLVGIHGLDVLRFALISTFDEQSPLLNAIRKGRTDIFQLVIGQLDVGHDSVVTLVLAAMESGNEIIFQRLLPMLGDDHYTIILESFCQRRVIEDIRFFLQQIPAHLLATCCTDSLLTVIRQKDVHILKVLIAGGAAIDRPTVYDEDSEVPQTLLQLIVTGGLQGFESASSIIQLIQLICDAGADTKITDEQGNTPLHYLAMMGPHNKRYKRIFSYAVKMNEIEVAYENTAKILINAGAGIDEKTHMGYTPLHWAVQRYERVLIKVLLKAGASTLIEDHYGFRASRTFSGKRGLDSRTSPEDMVLAYELKEEQAVQDQHAGSYDNANEGRGEDGEGVDAINVAMGRM